MSNAALLLHEISERLRGLESRLFAYERYPTMMIEQLKTKLTAFFDKAYANGRSEWVKTVISKTKMLVLSRLDSIKGQMEGLFDSEQFDTSVDFLTDFARGNIGTIVPWYLRLFVPSTDKLIAEMGVWLKANKGLFKEQIGTVQPTVS